MVPQEIKFLFLNCAGHKSDDKVKRFRCKARKYEEMRRTYWYAGLAALPALGQGAQPGNDLPCKI
jgi:hypothetical protein